MGARRGVADDRCMIEMHTNTILAGVDGSKHSADALALANLLAPHFQAEAVAAFVHPYGDYQRALGDGRYGDALRELADSVHDQMRDLGVPVDERRLLLVADRSAARGLERVADERHAMLIAVGASHRSRLGRALRGGTAERLMSGAPSPVAIAPSGYADEPRSLETIGIAFDGSPESYAALAWTKALARAGEMRVRVLTVHQPLVYAVPAFQSVPMVTEDKVVEDHLGRLLDEAARELEASDIEVEGRLMRGDAAGLLAEQSEELDLLVSGSRGYGPHRAVLLGSVSGALVRHAHSPVVVLPNDARVHEAPVGDRAHAPTAGATS
jgi:nucleotide-binding universal stress UspA family protein